MSEYGNPRLVRVLLIELKRGGTGRSYEGTTWGVVDPEAVIFAKQLDCRSSGPTVELRLSTGESVEVKGHLTSWWTEYDVA